MPPKARERPPRRYCGKKQGQPNTGTVNECYQQGFSIGVWVGKKVGRRNAAAEAQKPLEAMSLRELGTEASKRKIASYSKMTKAQLLAKLRGG